MGITESGILEREAFPRLVEVLLGRGHAVVGPTVRDGAILYDRIASAADLPAGWTDVQAPGSYRLKKRDDAALFGYVVGPHSWKKFLFPPHLRLWRAERDGGLFRVLPEPEPELRYAFLGVRPCEVHAIAIQDKVFSAVDPHYRSLRERALLVAVNCAQAGGTCFCVSMGTGPRVRSGFDLALTEVADGGRHFFVVEVGSERGREVARELPLAPASEAEASEVGRAEERASRQMGRSMQAADLKDLLYRNYDHPRWEDVARRCLSCANCTMACPTCFCGTVEETGDLAGDHAERWRRWDSCFTLDHSYIHGGSMRASARSRYRQWMTHKLATWIDQFGTSGCVGCGRCITWCPVGIDITEEVRAIRESEAKLGNHH